MLSAGPGCDPNAQVAWRLQIGFHGGKSGNPGNPKGCLSDWGAATCWGGRFLSLEAAPYWAAQGPGRQKGSGDFRICAPGVCWQALGLA
ncbi:hypothetical protein GCM10023172_01100 [Hymenobacter ginsengisoli]|uniref:Uncharacterized protein n=1 Tax=Hymenobacter ginsengisoli TaxID=1051626 RepID=A0ABP8PXL7_9BACT